MTSIRSGVHASLNRPRTNLVDVNIETMAVFLTEH
jgi:hypothetical protein